MPSLEGHRSKQEQKTDYSLVAYRRSIFECAFGMAYMQTDGMMEQIAFRIFSVSEQISRLEDVPGCIANDQKQIALHTEGHGPARI